MAYENKNILIELECPVCKEYMYPPIKQCVAGHSMCTVCFGKVKSCPTCRGTLATSRNFVLENILQKIKVPCKYKSRGCDIVQPGAVIRLHEEFCEHGDVQCPLQKSTSCSWVGRPKDIQQHAKENHDQHPPIVNNSEVRIKGFVQKSGEGQRFLLVDVNGQIFKYCINMYYSGNVIQWNIQYVGPRENASNYSYILKFVDKNNGKEKYTVISTCQQLVNDEKAFSPDNMCSIHFDKLCKFCGNDNCLYFHFQILPTKDLENNTVACLIDDEDLSTES